MNSKILTFRSRPVVLIVGGSGTLGRAFISQYYSDFQFHVLGRNLRSNALLESDFPNVRTHLADIQNQDTLELLFKAIKPDVVVHLAGLKRVDVAEENPSKTVEINILGSLNVARAALRADVPIVVGASTDKASNPRNMYGYSKKIGEQIFMEHHTLSSRFVCARFANVACSSGSVIPMWINSAMAGEGLRLTDKRMNRLMFSKMEAAMLIRDCISYAQKSEDTFVLCRRMKSVSLYELAISISDDFGNRDLPEVVGLRSGEQLNEILVSQAELPNAFYAEDGRYIVLHTEAFGQRAMSEELSSLTAEFMNVDEMRNLYSEYQDMMHPEQLLSVQNQ